jgi:hypothetical protein
MCCFLSSTFGTVPGGLGGCLGGVKGKQSIKNQYYAKTTTHPTGLRKDDGG